MVGCMESRAAAFKIWGLEIEANRAKPRTIQMQKSGSALWQGKVFHEYSPHNFQSCIIIFKCCCPATLCSVIERVNKL